MRDRIQKVLAERGLGSRRQVEAWIVAQRITVNGRLARPGQPVGEEDDIRLDGRKLRLRDMKRSEHGGLLYHRPVREEVRGSADSARRGSLERLPKAAGRRWIPVGPLSSNDGGLELFVTDGELAAALMRRGHELPYEYSVRVRGDVTDLSIAGILEHAKAIPPAAGVLTGIVPAGGEGTNQWLNVTCTGLRPRDLKGIFEQRGLEPNRVLRTRIGPIAMDRALARGRSRPMTDDELRMLKELVGPRGVPAADPAVARDAATRRRVTGSRKPVR
jgi:23S rRNA pseudouridine2605 synthase